MNKDLLPRDISAVVLDPSGHLVVRPDPQSKYDYSFIHRDASGIRWDPKEKGFAAYEPERWEPVTLLLQITAAVRNEYREQLQLTHKTLWLGIDDQLKVRLAAALSAVPEEETKK
jgi:hypothetical protein